MVTILADLLLDATSLSLRCSLAASHASTVSEIFSLCPSTWYDSHPLLSPEGARRMRKERGKLHLEPGGRLYRNDSSPGRTPIPRCQNWEAPDRSLNQMGKLRHRERDFPEIPLSPKQDWQIGVTAWLWSVGCGHNKILGVYLARLREKECQAQLVLPALGWEST